MRHTFSPYCAAPLAVMSVTNNVKAFPLNVHNTFLKRKKHCKTDNTNTSLLPLSEQIHRVKAASHTVDWKRKLAAAAWNNVSVYFQHVSETDYSPGTTSGEDPTEFGDSGCA